MLRKLGFLPIILFLFLLSIVQTTAQRELIFPIGEDERFNWASYEAFAAANDLTGDVLTIFGPWLGVDQERIESVIAYFEVATGANVLYAGSDSLEQQVFVELGSANPPNITIFPQPGLAADLAEQGVLTPLSSDAEAWVLENYAAGQSWVDLGTYADENGEEQFFGFFYKVDVKSLVWYVPENFAANGYEVPQTMEALLALSEQIIADGSTPWCIGLGSGDATGWPATDWIEDIVLRTAEPEVYDQWVRNEIPFNDERIVNAIEIFEQFAKDDNWVNGGASSVATLDFREAPFGLFTVPPECFMHRQASFIPSFFPEEGAELATGAADFFYFPAFEAEELGSPVLGAGTLFAITNDDPAARAWIEFLQTDIAHEIWMAQSGFLTPLISANPDAYANDALRGQGEILTDATTFRFDASDLMPGAIGAGAFWLGMVNLVNGASAEDVADDIQAAWDDL